jgi:hypothetical protein
VVSGPKKYGVEITPPPPPPPPISKDRQLGGGGGDLCSISKQVPKEQLSAMFVYMYEHECI